MILSHGDNKPEYGMGIIKLWVLQNFLSIFHELKTNGTFDVSLLTIYTTFHPLVYVCSAFAYSIPEIAMTKWRISVHRKYPTFCFNLCCSLTFVTANNKRIYKESFSLFKTHKCYQTRVSPWNLCSFFLNCGTFNSS